jgi:hypothetical protein
MIQLIYGGIQRISNQVGWGLIGHQTTVFHTDSEHGMMHINFILAEDKTIHAILKANSLHKIHCSSDPRRKKEREASKYRVYTNTIATGIAGREHILSIVLKAHTLSIGCPLC